MIVAGKFYLEYYISSFIRFLSATRVGHFDTARRIFGYLNKYPKQVNEINPQALTIDVEYEKAQMKYDFVNKYVCFNEEIDDKFPEPLRE